MSVKYLHRFFVKWFSWSVCDEIRVMWTSNMEHACCVTFQLIPKMNTKAHTMFFQLFAVRFILRMDQYLDVHQFNEHDSCRISSSATYDGLLLIFHSFLSKCFVFDLLLFLLCCNAIDRPLIFLTILWIEANKCCFFFFF